MSDVNIVGPLRRVVIRGGPGSGHRGHVGRLGEVGGSLPSGSPPHPEPVKEADEISRLVEEKIGGLADRVDVWDTIGSGNAAFWISPAGNIYRLSPFHSHQLVAEKAFSMIDFNSSQKRDLDNWLMNEQGDEGWHNNWAHYYMLSNGWVRLNVSRGPLYAEYSERPAFQFRKPVGRKTAKIIKEIALLAEEKYSDTSSYDQPYFDDNDSSGKGIRELFYRIGVTRGGPGSGHHGHVGRPGEVGGSAPAGTPPPPKEVSGADKPLLDVDKMEMPEDVMPSSRAENFDGFLYHGSTISNLESISNYGIIPERGEMVSWAYGEYMDEEYDDPQTGESMVGEYAYFTGPRSADADESALEAAIKFSKAAIAFQKYDGDQSKVTVDDLRKHGLVIAVGAEDIEGYDLRIRDNKNNEWSVVFDWETGEIHYEETYYSEKFGPEPGDYFTTDAIDPSKVIYGDELVRLVYMLEHGKAPAPKEQMVLPGFESKSWVPIVRGGPGSGHHGHVGRPGEVGGSAPAGTPPRTEKVPGLDVDLYIFPEEIELPELEGEEYEERARALEQFLLEKYGEGDWESSAWIGPSGKTLCPLCDHQASALEVLSGAEKHLETFDEMADAIEVLTHGVRPEDDRELVSLMMDATWTLVHSGLIRYNTSESRVDFDVPKLGNITESQWAQMAAIATKLQRYAKMRHGRAANIAIGISVTENPSSGQGDSEYITGFQAWKMLGIEDLLTYRGGPGSGHHGHVGRLDEVGGSLPSGSPPHPKPVPEPDKPIAEKLDVDQMIIPGVDPEDYSQTMEADALEQWARKNAAQMLEGTTREEAFERIRKMQFSPDMEMPTDLIEQFVSFTDIDTKEKVDLDLTPDETWRLIKAYIDHYESDYYGDYRYNIQQYFQSEYDGKNESIYSFEEIAEWEPSVKPIVDKIVAAQGSETAGSYERLFRLNIETPAMRFVRRYMARKEANQRQLTLGIQTTPTTIQDYYDQWSGLNIPPNFLPGEATVNPEYRKTMRMASSAVMNMAQSEIQELGLEHIRKLDREAFNGPYVFDLFEPHHPENRSPEAQALADELGEEEYGRLFTFSLWMERKRAEIYKFEERHSVALGLIEPGDAETNGPRPWEPMPDQLWHVTTNADAIVNDRIKSRLELSMESGYGLGGGDDQTISFSASRDVAINIEKSIQDAHDAAAGYLSPIEMLRMAERGENAERPYIEEALNHAGWTKEYEAGWRPSHDYDQWPERIRKSIESTMGDYGSGDPDGGLTGESLTQRRYERLQFFKFAFLGPRDRAGGPDDPIFWNSDPDGLAELDPDGVRTLEYSPRSGARGFNLGSGLGEWRTVGGDTVELMDVIDVVPYEQKSMVKNTQVFSLAGLPLSIPPSVVTEEGLIDIAVESEVIPDSMVARGGPGSGHHGHVGREGEVGGSAPAGTPPPPDPVKGIESYGEGVDEIDATPAEELLPEYPDIEIDEMKIPDEKLRYAQMTEDQITIDDMLGYYPEPTKEGYEVVYHCTRSNENLMKILEEGLLAEHATGREAPEGMLWACTEPDGYSDAMPLVVMQVPKDDPRVEHPAKGLVTIWGDVPSEDILQVYPMIEHGPEGGSEIRRLDKVLYNVDLQGSSGENWDWYFEAMKKAMNEWHGVEWQFGPSDVDTQPARGSKEGTYSVGHVGEGSEFPEIDARLVTPFAGIREGFKIESDKGEASGYLNNAYQDGEKKSDVGELFYVEVPETERGQGYGTALAVNSLQQMWESGSRSVLMDPVTPEGAGLIEKLQRMGYIGEAGSGTGKEGRIKEYPINGDVLTGNDALAERGGPGSGHHGHRGRPGKVGGSLPKGQAGSSIRDEIDVNEYGTRVGYRIMDFFKHPNSSIWKGFDEALEAIDDVHSVEQLADLEIKRTGSKIRSGYYRCTVWNGEYTPKELRLATSRDADQQYLAWTTVHEMGHVLDHQMFGRGTKFMSEQVELHADSLRATESYAHLDVSNDPNEAYAFMDWWDAVQSSDSYKALKNFDRGIYSFNPETGQWRKGMHENATHYAELGSSAIRSYLDPKELFARAYVQYIATRSGNATLNAQLEKELQDQDAGFAPLQWRPEEFKPIAEAMDEILRVKGCLKE